jgi:hypothetical protein
MSEADPSAIPQYLLFAGEGVSALTSAHIEALRQSAAAMAGGLIVHTRLVTNADLERGLPRAVDEPITLSATPEELPDPVPMSRDNFRDYALAHGHTDQRGYRAFSAICSTYMVCEADADSALYRESLSLRAYPPIRILSGIDRDWLAPERAVVDLTSVWVRLAATTLDSRAWAHKPSAKTMRFLTDIVRYKFGEDALPETNQASRPLA